MTDTKLAAAIAETRDEIRRIKVANIEKRITVRSFDKGPEGNRNHYVYIDNKRVYRHYYTRIVADIVRDALIDGYLLREQEKADD